MAPELDALNTGILCDGLWPVDIDIDDPDTAVRGLCLAMLSQAPMHFRDNTARVLVLYRAAEGSPPGGP